MSLNFETIPVRDAECRCCGSGTKKVCTQCKDDIAAGKAFFLEVILQGKSSYRYFTRYVIAIQANQVYQHGSTMRVPMTPGIYLITEEHLKEFMKDEYRIGFTGTGEHTPKFLDRAPELDHSKRKSAGSARQAVELPHKHR